MADDESGKFGLKLGSIPLSTPGDVASASVGFALGYAVDALFFQPELLREPSLELLRLAL